ncbi:prevent-host-death family protein [Jatrophihabitans endophyticus]|uniref:Antitoxin n=1 Tax=Jatrophihabitans endophyticus TaxID=1206085 RepID=A0A1M5TBM9_9ACTN|nr:type II toxin-antitoxin system prevent-host-death family antitoxin [Jatrophihabitans endophyticus]SHH48119.1 prevent-host-death family protein [Jatrophihabitans endophyticus]
MPTQVNIYDAKTNLSKLIDRVLAGEQVVIARAGRPVVDLVAHTGSPIVLGGLKNQIHFDQDEFDAADSEIRRMFDVAGERDAPA